MYWAKQKITYIAYHILDLSAIILFSPILAGILTYQFAPQWLNSFITRRANNTIFHAYYKILAWLSPNARVVRQYQFGCSWLDYLTGKSKDKPLSRFEAGDDEEDIVFSQDYGFIPRNMRTYCSILERTPIDLVCMQVIARGLANNTTIKKLEFCPGVITDDGMQVLADFLSQNKTIEELSIIGDYDFFIHHDGETHFRLEDSSIESLTKSLIHNQALRKLNLSYLMLSNTSWLHLIYLVEHNDRINELILSGNSGRPFYNWASKINEEIVTKLTSALLKKQNIQILDLTDCYIDDEGAKIIAKLLTPQSKIKTLKLSKNKITTPGLQAIAENLHLANSITTLDISNNKQNDTAGAEAIFNAISQNSTLKNISLGNMGIDGIMPLAAVAVRRNKTLHSMDLSYNHSSNQHDIEPLADALMINTSLENLNLMATGIGNVALTILTRAFSAFSLKWLDLSKNDLNGSVNETTVSIQSLGVALGENKSLRYLALPTVNTVDNINMLFITDGLTHNNTLAALNLGDNDIRNAESLTRFLVSPNSVIRSLSMSNCKIGFFRQLLPALAANPQTLRLNTLLSGTEEAGLTECIQMIQPIVQYRNQELRSFYCFLAKNKNGELRDNTEHTLKHLPEDICKKIREYIPAPFEIH